MKDINDNYILLNCLKKSGDPNPNSYKDDLVQKYLKERYTDIPCDMFSYAEVIFRIKNNITERPVCAVCGEPVKYIHRKNKPYSSVCSRICGDTIRKEKSEKIWENRTENDIANIKEKTRNTNILKYGTDYIFKLESFKEQSRISLLEKYGDSNYGKFGSQSFKDKMVKKYGEEYPQTNEEVRQKISLSHQSTEVKEKTKKTCLEKYGVTAVTQLPEVQDKIILTYRTNNTFNSSKDEEVLYDILISIFSPYDVERNYKSVAYPFKCDFYIKSLLLYIEYQGSMYHNLHLFNYLNDKQLLLYFLKKTSENKPNRYNSLIDTWTKRDIIKWDTGVNNNINMLFIYPLFHEQWSYYKQHSNSPDIETIKKEIQDKLKNFIYNNYNLQTRQQLKIGEDI